MTDKPTPTTDLLKRCAEIHEWRSTGVLSGEALRDYAKRKWPDRHDTLQMAEHETVTEALALLAKWGQPVVAGDVDRADAVNLARNALTQYDCAITKKGVRVLAEAVLSMDSALTTEQPAPAGATEEVENLRKALVYAAFALHDTPQYMLAQGIALIDGDTVRVSRDGWTVEASVNPHRQPAPATQQAGEVRRAELVPGVMHCAKCKFQLNRVTLCVSDGNAYAGNNKTEPCPNGCGPLWPVTWEQEAKNCWKALEEMHERLMAAAAPQPSPMAQAADSVTAPAPPPECETEAEKRAFAFGWFKALESERMKAESVQEDAARWRELREQHESDENICCVFAPNDMRECLVPVGSLPGELDAFMDSERAARKQGASHDR